MILLSSKFLFSYYFEVRFSLKHALDMIIGTTRKFLFVLTQLHDTFFLPKYIQIKPLVGPTKEIMKINVNKYEWHEFFPQGPPYAILLFVFFLTFCNIIFVLTNYSQAKIMILYV